jgi:hypothetical protein
MMEVYLIICVEFVFIISGKFESQQILLIKQLINIFHSKSKIKMYMFEYFTSFDYLKDFLEKILKYKMSFKIK